MKRVVLTFVFFVTLGLCSNSLNAQSDGFFNSNSNTFEYRNSDEELPVLPRFGTDYDQKAPIGSGLLILTGLGLGYLSMRKKD